MGKPERISKIIGEGYVPDFEAEPVMAECDEGCHKCPETQTCSLAIRKIILIYNSVITGKATFIEAREEVARGFGQSILEKKQYPHWRAIIDKDTEDMIIKAVKALQGKEGEQRDKEWKGLKEGLRETTVNILNHCARDRWFSPFLTRRNELKLRRALKPHESKPGDLIGVQADPDFISEEEDLASVEQGELFSDVPEM